MSARATACVYSVAGMRSAELVMPSSGFVYSVNVGEKLRPTKVSPTRQGFVAMLGGLAHPPCSSRTRHTTSATAETQEMTHRTVRPTSGRLRPRLAAFLHAAATSATAVNERDSTADSLSSVPATASAMLAVWRMLNSSADDRDERESCTATLSAASRNPWLSALVAMLQATSV